MKTIIAYLFPLFDYLYIFQAFEYQPISFLEWFIKYPLKRNLQRKHSLEKTSKAVLLFCLTIFLLAVFSLALFILLPTTISIRIRIGIFIIFFLLFAQLSPLFLLLSQLIIYPVEWYQKRRIVSAAKKKLEQLPNLKRIAVVGSYAKTSTKDALYTLLWKKYRVVKTPKSYNTLLSIARTILTDVKDNTEVFIVEMDAYHPGEINELCKLVKPNMGIITAIAPQHLERFGSMEKLVDAQFELADNLSENGILFLNNTDEYQKAFILGEVGKYKIKTFGFSKHDDFSVNTINQTIDGIEFKLSILRPPSTTLIHLPLFGAHHVINFLGAAAIASSLNLNPKEIQERALKILPTPHRLEVKEQGPLTIIDNSYNTNPTSSQAALKLLDDYPGKQKVIITPGLIELGAESDKENALFAERAAKVADQLFIVGENAKDALLQGLAEANYPLEKIHTVKNVQEGLAQLTSFPTPETVVLLENDLPDQYF